MKNIIYEPVLRYCTLELRIISEFTKFGVKFGK